MNPQDQCRDDDTSSAVIMQIDSLKSKEGSSSESVADTVASSSNDSQISISSSVPLEVSEIDTIAQDKMLDAIERPIQLDDISACSGDSHELKCVPETNEHGISKSSCETKEQKVLESDLKLHNMQIQLQEALDRATVAEQKLTSIGQCVRVLTNQLLRHEADIVSNYPDEKNTKENRSNNTGLLESNIEDNVAAEAAKVSYGSSNESKCDWNITDKIDFLSTPSSDSGDFDGYDNNHDKNGQYSVHTPVPVVSYENSNNSLNAGYYDGNRIRTNTFSSIASNGSRNSQNSVSSVVEEHEQFLSVMKQIQGVLLENNNMRDRLSPPTTDGPKHNNNNNDTNYFVVLDLVSLQNAAARIWEHTDLAFQDSYEAYQDSCHWKESSHHWHQRALQAESELKKWLTKYGDISTKNKQLRNQRRMLIHAYRTISAQKHEILVHQVEDFVVHALSVHEQHLKTKATTSNRGTNTTVSYRGDSILDIDQIPSQVRSSSSVSLENVNDEIVANMDLSNPSDQSSSTDAKDNNPNLATTHTTTNKEENSIVNQNSNLKKEANENDKDHVLVEPVTAPVTVDTKSVSLGKSSLRNNFVGGFGVGFESCYNSPAPKNGKATKGNLPNPLSKFGTEMTSKLSATKKIDLVGVTTEGVGNKSKNAIEREGTVDSDRILEVSTTAYGVDTQKTVREPVLRITIGDSVANIDTPVKQNQQITKTSATNCDSSTTNDKNNIGARMMNFFNPPLNIVAKDGGKRSAQSHPSSSQMPIESTASSAKNITSSSSSTTLRPLISKLDLISEPSHKEKNTTITNRNDCNIPNPANKNESLREVRDTVKVTQGKDNNISNLSNVKVALAPKSLGLTSQQNHEWNAVHISKKSETVSSADSPIRSLKSDSFPVHSNGISPTTIVTDFEITDDQILRSLSIPVDDHVPP